MRRLLLALVAAACIAPAFAQTPYPAGPSNQSNLATVAPTAPPGDNSDRVATTAFVAAAVSGGGLPGLPSAQIWVGSGGGVAVARTVTGDCTLSNLGAIVCTKTNNVSFAPSATTDTTNATNIASGTLASARGGAGAITGALKGSGAGVVSQAACADLSNGAASCSTDTTNAANISSGTLPAGRLPNPSASTLGGIQSLTCAANQWLNTISTAGVPACAQPAFSNLSGNASATQETAALDTLTGCTTQGSVLYRNAATWVCLGPGTSGQLLSSGGPAANPSWITASGTGTVTSVVCSGVTITSTGTCPPAFGFANCAITAAVAGNNLTVTLTDNAGATPSAGSPCNVWFRSATAAQTAGNPIWVQRTVTAATTFTANAGSTFGVANSAASCLAASSCPFRLWVTLIDTGSTAVLGVVNLTNASGVRPLNQSGFVTSTVCSACAGATAIGTMYSTAAQATKPFQILGYMDWGSGLGTAGTYASGPTLIQTMGPGVALPGRSVQHRAFVTQSVTSGTLNTYQSSAITDSITPQAAPNLIRYSFSTTAWNRATTAAVSIYLAMHNNTTLIGGIYSIWGQSQQGNASVTETYYDAPGSTSAQTYTLKFRNTDSTTNMSVPTDGTNAATLTLEEIQG